MIELLQAEQKDFKDFYSLLALNFIPDEIRDEKETLNLYVNESFRLFKIISDGKKVGFISVWKPENFSFIEHLVIADEYKNMGLGGAALEELKKTEPFIVLECEPPENEIKSRRLRFYKRHGFVENPLPYQQPPYRESGAAVPLVLMSYPEPLSDQKRAAEQIYLTVYGKIYK